MENALTGVLVIVAMAYASRVSGVQATTIGAGIAIAVSTGISR